MRQEEKKLPVRYHKTETAPIAGRSRAYASERKRFLASFQWLYCASQHATRSNAISKRFEAHTEYTKARGNELAEAVLRPIGKSSTISSIATISSRMITNSISIKWKQTATRALTREKSANTRGNWRGNAGSRNSIRHDLRQRQRGSDLMCSTNRFPTGKKSFEQNTTPGALDAEIEMLMRDKKIDEITAKEKPTDICHQITI